MNGLTLKKLQDLGAQDWTKGRSNKLATFLNEYSDLPIVAFNAKYDRDDVLGSAFDKVGNILNLPDKGRWRCTYKLSYRIPNLETRHLDDVLRSLEIEPRKGGEYHDAITDATLSGFAYMKLIKMPDLDKPKLGFCKK